MTTFDTDWTPVERTSSLVELRGLRHDLHRVKLVAYTALAIAGGLLAGAVLAIIVAMH